MFSLFLQFIWLFIFYGWYTQPHEAFDAKQKKT